MKVSFITTDYSIAYSHGDISSRLRRTFMAGEIRGFSA